MAIKKVILTLMVIFFNVKSFAVEITMWSGHESLKDLQFAARMFKQKTGHNVNVKVFYIEAMRSELLRNANRKTFPDMTMVPADFLGLYKELNLRPLDNSWGLQKINSTALRSVQLNGNYYGLPVIVGNHLLLYYNKALVSRPAKSWQEFEHQHQRILAPLGKKSLAWNYNSIYRFSSFLETFDAWPIKNNRISLATPQMVDALSVYKTKNQSNFVVQNCDSRCSVNKMKREEVAYTITGDWEHTELYAALGSKLGVAPLPYVDGHKMKSLSTSFALATPLHSRNNQVEKAVKDFAAFLASDEIQQLFYDNYNLLPANSKVLNKIQKRAKGNSKIMIEEFLQSFPMPSEYRMSIVWSILRLGFRDLTEQEFTPEEVTLRMQKLADRAQDKEPEGNT